MARNRYLSSCVSIYITGVLTGLLIVTLVACGGSNSSGQLSNPLPVSISISPGTANLIAGTAFNFTATVTNANNAGVTWSVQEGTAAGAITAAGSFTPAKAGTFHIVATSQADTSKTAVATVTVIAPTPTFTSQPATAAAEGQAYSYTPQANDPARSAMTFAMTGGPAGATMSAGTLTWTPTHSQARTAASFTVSVTTAAGGSATQNWSVIPTGIIAGLALQTHVTESGDTDRPRDATNDIVKAHVPGPSGFTTLDGSGNATGQYTVPGVPAGNYWLQINHDYIWTVHSDIDLGLAVAGRTGLQTASAGTAVSLSVSTTTPLNAPDHFEVFVPNAGVVRDQAVTTYTSGDTAANVDVSWSNASLSDSSLGDQTYVMQLHQLTLVNGMRFYFLGDAAGPLGLTTVDGASTSLSASLDWATNSVAFEGWFNGSEFVGLQTAVNPNAKVRGTNISFGVQAMGNSHGSLQWPNPRLVAYYGEDGAISTDVDLYMLGGGNPFPTQWPLLLDYDQPFAVIYTVPGTSLKLTLICHVRTASLPSYADPVRPLVAPVISPTINGNSFFADQSGVGLNPVLSWTAPTTATGYRVSIWRLFDGGGSAAAEEIGVLHTTATSITVPPGVMTAGNAYFVVIQAHSEPGTDYSYSPYRHALPHGLAATTSGIVTP